MDKCVFSEKPQNTSRLIQYLGAGIFLQKAQIANGQEMDGFQRRAEAPNAFKRTATPHLGARACALADESWFVRADESSFVSRDSAAVSHLIETDLVNNERLNPHHHASRLLFNGCRSFSDGARHSFLFVHSFRRWFVHLIICDFCLVLRQLYT